MSEHGAAEPLEVFDEAVAAERPITHAYADPLEIIWAHAAAAGGWTLVRDPEVYASWDGESVLRVCPASDYDPDDSLAQMILHEACHHLVQGPDSWHEIDWGLLQDGDEAAIAEHACHRLQAKWTQTYGLRALLAPTSKWRPYWDALPEDPLADGDDPAIARARAAWARAQHGPLALAIHEALRRTATIADLVQPLTTDTTCLWAHTARGSARSSASSSASNAPNSPS